MNDYYVYILSNKIQSIFYTGITNDLLRRVYEHKYKLVEGFTSRYNISELMYFEKTPDPESAIIREKQIKKYSQKKKIELIQLTNPGMNNIYDQVLDD